MSRKRSDGEEGRKNTERITEKGGEIQGLGNPCFLEV
jgi:hypothetical protein